MRVAPPPLFQTALHRYAFERELGSGGMATVYLARELHTGSNVAIKVLRPELAPVLGIERFRREIQITTRLTHPNILPVLDSGEVDGLPFYVTPYVPGETLADRLRREDQLPIGEAIAIASRVAEALEAAHAEGFVHRDIKPSNILLADDRVILADFGLARAVDVISAEQLTQSGIAIGTPAYMSPEQSTAGQHIDGRSDLYSLGCVLYEMLAGGPPFTGPSAQSVLARHAIDPVPSLRTVRSTVSPKLESIVVRALAKVPADRYASAAELRQELRSLAPPDATGGGRHASDRRKRPGGQRVAALLIMAVLGLAVGILWVTRVPGSASAMPGRREPLLIADFSGLSKDSSLGSVISDALRIDFAQSHVARVVPAPQIADVLGRMRLPPTTRLTPELTREIAIREGIKALVTGDVAEAGPQYIITASLVAAATGEILIARRETAQDSSGIVGAIDELSEFLRRRLGESLGSLRAEPPLSRAATGSLDALRKFTQAGRAYYLEGNAPKARELYEEAIGLDSTFGLAYVRLTDLLWHAYEHQIDRIAWTQNQSFAQRNRLPLRDRYLVEASYYNRVLYDFDKSIATYRALLELYPDDTEALSALGAVCFAARHYADGEAAVRRFVAIDSTSFYDWLNLSDLEIAQGKRQAAKQTVAHMVRLFPKNEEVDWWRAELEAAFGNYGAAEALLDTLTRHYPRTFYSREWTTWSQGNIAAVRGRLGKAVVYFRDGMAASTAEGNRARYFEFASTLASYQLRILRRPDLAVKELERALVQYPLDSLPALERPYFAVAEVLAQAGHPDRAQELLVQYERDVAPAYRPMVEGNRHTRLGAQGEIDLAEGRVGDAINAFRAWSEKGQCLGCGLTALARAFQRAGLPDSAVAAYERYLNTMWVERVMVDADELAATHRELGGLYALRGDTTRAVQAYERFLKLWENADQELQPQVAEVRRRLSDLRRETAIR